MDSYVYLNSITILNYRFHAILNQKNCLKAKNSVTLPSLALWTKKCLCPTHTREVEKRDIYCKVMKYLTSTF